MPTILKTERECCQNLNPLKSLCEWTNAHNNTRSFVFGVYSLGLGSKGPAMVGSMP